MGEHGILRQAMGQVNDNCLFCKCLYDPVMFSLAFWRARNHRSVLPEETRQTACKPGSVEDGHSSWARVTARLVRPARTEAETPSACRQAAPSLFGLAPGGVYRAVSVAGDAVRTYRTVSPLPARKRAGGLFSAALSLESPPPGVTRHRVSVEPGLSSPGTPRERPSGRLAMGFNGISGPGSRPPVPAEAGERTERARRPDPACYCEICATAWMSARVSESA